MRVKSGSSWGEMLGLSTVPHSGNRRHEGGLHCLGHSVQTQCSVFGGFYHCTSLHTVYSWEAPMGCWDTITEICLWTVPPRVHLREYSVNGALKLCPGRPWSAMWVYASRPKHRNKQRALKWAASHKLSSLSLFTSTFFAQWSSLSSTLLSSDTGVILTPCSIKSLN